MLNIKELNDKDLINLINNRWTEGESLFSNVSKVYDRNTIAYDSDINSERLPDYLKRLPNTKQKVRANRIFVNTESVINSLIANPPHPNFIPARNTPEAIELASIQEKFFLKRYSDRNVRETLRKALRNLYFSRWTVLKIFWNPSLDDFDVISIDPRKVRVSPTSTKEEESDYVIEEVPCNLSTLIERFPEKEKEILEKSAFRTKDEVYITNPKVSYQECWINDYLVCKYGDLVLAKIKNPYWDWDGLILTKDEQDRLSADPSARSSILETAKAEQETRKAYNASPEATECSPEGDSYNSDESSVFGSPSYFFNHFSTIRKPYIFATILNNENTPIGRTSLIEESASLQEAIDRRKQQIHDNADMMNGLLKIDSSVVSSKAEAQKIRHDVAAGFVWGKGVVNGIGIDTGSALPNFIFEDMLDSRSEIDNIMAASSAFRGEREGSETKAGRLALIDQSYLRLNELVQVVDYICYEMFNWMYHLAKVKYTETHYAKEMGSDNALKIIELQQNDFEDGTEVKIISGKTLPEDKQFKMNQAQNDVQTGILSPVDYLKIAGYDNPMELAKNSVMFKMNPPMAVGMEQPEVQQAMPQPPQELAPQAPLVI